MISGINSEWSEIIRKCSPAYLEAYQEGYEQAKKEMRDMLDSMRALYECSATIGVGENSKEGGK